MPTVFPPLTPTKENTMSYFIFLIGLVFRRPFFTNCIILLLCSGVNSIIAFGNFGVGFFLGRGGKTILSPGLGRLGGLGLGKGLGRLSPGLGLSGPALLLPPFPVTLRAVFFLFIMLDFRSNLFELV
jgi:hypothetical protein